MKRLVLWDIDGTLVHSGGAGREVFEVAVSRVLERAVDREAFASVRMGGKTDPQIAREVLRVAEVADDDIDRHLPDVLRHIEDELAAAAERIRRDGRALPGAEAILRRLHDEPGVVQTVLTGNVAANAAVKLGAFGLERWLDLDVGAYGSDHHDRSELVPIAIEKVARRDGHRFTPAETWVIGDTERDFACAAAAGARCLLVATGAGALDDLGALGADAVLPNLDDTSAVVAILAS